MMNKIRKIGIMSNAFRAMAGLDTVYGYDIAVNENVSALLKYGSFEEVDYFFEPLQYQEVVIRRKYSSLKRKDKTQVDLKFISELDLLNGSEKPKIDVLHNVDMEFMPQIYYRESCGADMFPVTYMIHGASYPYYINNFFLMKLLVPFKQFDSLICTSSAVRSAISNILESLQYSMKDRFGIDVKYEGRLDVLPLGIDTNFFSPKDKSECRNKFAVSKEAFVILWIGRFSAYDKADLLPVFLACKRILNKNPNREIKIIIAGHDRKNMPILDVMKEYVKALGLEGNFVFLEGHNLAERAELYSCSDVFISPIDNVQETFGLTPIEAMACGVPQIVSDWDGYKDTVEDGVTGYRIPTYWMKCDGDIEKNPMLPSEPMHRSAVQHLMMAQSVAMDLRVFERCVQNLIDDPVLWKKMSKNSIERARRIYEWKELIPRYEGLWSELKQLKNEYQSVQNKCLDGLIFTPHYCDYFASYPTQFLNNNTEVEITDEGKEVVEGKIRLPIHYEIEQYLGINDISMEVLKMLAQNVSLSCERLTDILNAYSEDKVKRAIMFLLKQGYIDLFGKNVI